MEVRVTCWKPSSSRRNDGRQQFASNEGGFTATSIAEALDKIASGKHGDHSHEVKVVAFSPYS